jgi:Uri superfamily endonuclease
MQGAYTLLIGLRKPANIAIGRRRRYYFEAGYYAYVGSALSNLEKRVERHLRKEKKFHWHIDYFLNDAEVRQVVYAITDGKYECHIAREMLKNLEFKPGFGCSDCRCPSHLFYQSDFDMLRETVLNSFRAINLLPVEISAGQSSSKEFSSLLSSEGSMSCAST